MTDPGRLPFGALLLYLTCLVLVSLALIGGNVFVLFRLGFDYFLGQGFVDLWLSIGWITATVKLVEVVESRLRRRKYLVGESEYAAAPA